MALEIEQFMARGDNFCVLVHDPDSHSTVLIDAPREEEILAALDRTGWNLTHILITHHHGDHVEALKPLKHRFTPKVFGPKGEADKIDGLDELVGDGDTISICNQTVEVIETPGHTAGHVCYYFPKSGLLFAADTLFAMGCGRLFEKGPAEMQKSFDKLAALPDETQVYCGHEYTLANAKFAVTVDPDNEALRERLTVVDVQRQAGEMTLPTTIGLEKQTNPYFRTSDASLKAALGMENASPTEVFAEIRGRKDRF
ncbi:hydroxyacylglutathione hydrolase [Notoacmeibacter sp. MSK16QG-6]|uniref:hydroxyacylglutathione hydrolase n=1 Tax=Notoacmeibacter sp. MSK16QG-6 TaxID=2957982 RepID=UPI00209EE364|nr:hydroxyacylglutathione hydrolase [Notoacmeibacter sp. MSK16QG-6]MCP1199991.1 hydroxyacylglutathione hydrolase [Notoacmeibacter sp. MSK16QG-6]